MAKYTFLIHTFCATGHVLPMQALAAALVARGHRVVWLTSPTQESRALASGAEYIPTSAVVPYDDALLAAQPASLEELAEILFSGRVSAVVEDMRRAIREKDLKIDCVLNDAVPYGAKALHDLGEAPVWATLGVVPMYSADNESRSPLGRLLSTPEFALPVINTQRARLGLEEQTADDPFNYSPFLHVQASCADLEFGAQTATPSTRFVGPLVAQSKASSLPSWWEDVERHSCVVGITQGTYAVDPSTLIIPAIEALADEQDLLLVVPSPLAGQIRKTLVDKNIPLDNVRLADWVPYDALLPRCRALVTNGGYGSVTQALAHGVPLVCAGTSEDKVDTAARVVAVGAGVDLKTDTPERGRIREAVLGVLGDEGYGKRAAGVGEILNGLGGATRACELLEELVGGRAV